MKQIAKYAQRGLRSEAARFFFLAGLGAVVAYAQSGTLDTSGIENVATRLLIIFRLVGVAAIIAGLTFAVFKFMGRDMMGGVLGVVGGIIGAVIIGYAPSWATSLTGVTVATN
jgi:hypothetical protein